MKKTENQKMVLIKNNKLTGGFSALDENQLLKIKGGKKNLDSVNGMTCDNSEKLFLI